MKALVHRIPPRLAFAVAALLLLAGCAGVIPIKTLLDDPGHYDGRTVQVAGTVKGGVSILNVGTYQVDDGTGTLFVVTKEGGAPREGAKVAVRGEFKSAFTLGSETVAVLVEKDRKAY
jgi:hypothetical protein